MCGSNVTLEHGRVLLGEGTSGAQSDGYEQLMDDYCSRIRGLRFYRKSFVVAIWVAERTMTEKDTSSV